MTAIATNTTRRIRTNAPNGIYGVKDATKIFQGAYLGVDTTTPEGFARPFAASATPDEFIGIALEFVDNSGGADSDLFVEVATSGVLEDVPVTGAADGAQELGNDVYVSDSGTLTLTLTNNGLIGQVFGFRVDSGNYDVYFRSSFLQ